MFFSATLVVELISETRQEREAVYVVGRHAKEIPRFYGGNHLREDVLVCVSAYCLQSTKTQHGIIQGIKTTVLFGEDV